MQQKFDRSQVGARMLQKLASLAKGEPMQKLASLGKGCRCNRSSLARKGEPMQQKLVLLAREAAATEARFVRKGGKGAPMQQKFVRSQIGARM